MSFKMFGLMYCIKHNEIYEKRKDSKKCDCNELANISNKRFIKWLLEDKPILLIKEKIKIKETKCQMKN